MAKDTLTPAQLQWAVAEAQKLRDKDERDAYRLVRRASAITSGVPGVYPAKAKDRWHARFKQAGTVYTLGTFDNVEAAAQAIRDKREELKGNQK